MKKIMSLLLLLTSALFVSAQIPNSGLVAWYPFTGNANDSSGNGHNGAVLGAHLTINRFGTPNSAYSFIGNDQYIDVPDASILRLSNTDYTISVWVYKLDSLANSNYAIIAKRYSDGQKGYILQIPSSYYQIEFQVSGYQDPYLHSDSAIAFNTWQHIVITYKLTTSTLKMYLNDKLVGTGSIPSPNGLISTAFRIGNDTWVGYVPSYGLNGKIDDLRIYNRVLTNSEIKTIYQEGVDAPIATNQYGCQNSIIPNLTATGTNIKWYSDSTLTNLVHQGNTFTTGQTNVGMYKYYVTQTIASIEGPPLEVSLTINNILPSDPTAPSGINALCQNTTSTNYSTTPSTNTTGYVWKINPANAGIMTGTSTTVTVAWNSNFYGTAYIKVKAQNLFCESKYSDSIAVTVLQAALANMTPNGPTTFCQGNSVLLNANTGTNLFYIWKKDGATIGSATNSSYIANQSGLYTVEVNNSNNCPTTSSPVTVTVNPLPAATITPTGSTTICQGQTVTLNANIGSGLTYQWKKNGIDIPGAMGASCLAAQTGVYSVIVTNATMCSSTSSDVNVTVNPSPSASITAHGSTSFCQGNSVLLTSNHTLGITYQWQKKRY